MKNFICTTYRTTCGQLLLGADDTALHLASWTGTKAHERLLKHMCAPLQDGTNEILRQAIDELDAYFAGRLRTFTVPLSYDGTPFRTAVWCAVGSVPFGTTISYGTLARKAGYPQAVRALANAVGANPLSVFIPCHRVVASNGIGGYAGGVEAKRALLELENQILF